MVGQADLPDVAATKGGGFRFCRKNGALGSSRLNDLAGGRVNLPGKIVLDKAIKLLYTSAREGRKNREMISWVQFLGIFLGGFFTAGFLYMIIDPFGPFNKRKKTGGRR